MAIERIFVKEGIKEADVEKFLEKKFEKSGYSHTEIQRTPLGTRIIIYAHKPGLIIGKSGRRISELTEEIKEKFGFENPLVDVKEVENPLLDPKIVSKRICRALKKGTHYKRVANYYLQKIMEAGAIGVQIRIAGKLTGSERSRTQKFEEGFVAHSGEYADRFVKKGSAQTTIKPGTIGVQIKMMKEAPEEVTFKKGLKKEEKSEEPEK
jgi:small subunit ribosomal protein S3